MVSEPPPLPFTWIRPNLPVDKMINYRSGRIQAIGGPIKVISKVQGRRTDLGTSFSYHFRKGMWFLHVVRLVSIRKIYAKTPVYTLMCTCI